MARKLRYGFDVIVNEEEAKASLENARHILEKMKELIG
jgi:tRNA splicing ligase